MSLVQLLNFDVKGDDRGQLVALESMRNIPFDIKRIYYLTSLASQKSRGFHAHKRLKQVAVCLAGSCRFVLDNGALKEETVLDSPDKGLLIPDMLWHEMHDFSENCVLMVLASDYYDEADYIRSEEEFKKRVTRQ